MSDERRAGSGAKQRRRAHRSGIRAEWLAIALLRVKGYSILARRYSAPGGEIDVIARRGDTIAFVEVRRRARLETAQVSITPQKRQRIRRAVRAWLTRHPAAIGRTLRVDAIFLAPWRWPRHVRNLYELEL